MPGVAEDDEDNTDVADLTALAYSLTLRGFDQQQHTLAELRSRTGTLLTASSLLVTFLGALAIDRAGLGPLGIVAYGLSGIVCVWILIPRRFVFRVTGTDLVESQWGLPIDEERVQVYRDINYISTTICLPNTGGGSQVASSAGANDKGSSNQWGGC